MPNIIRQGVDCWIEANNITNVRTGDPMDVTGFAVYGVARAIYDRWFLGKPNYLRGGWRFRPSMWSPVVSEWSTSPTGTQGSATAGGAITNQVVLHVTPAQTRLWKCPLVLIQAELTDPITSYVERIIDEVYEVNFEAVQAGN